MIRALPNLLTLLNLVSGGCAIAALFENKPLISLILAVFCLLVDVLDGLLARRLNVTSALGVQLDSLADSVSFGILPACMAFVLLKDCTPAGYPEWLRYTSFIFAGGVALRLARFNIDTRERTVFFGLPTPTAATFLFGLLLMQITAHEWWEYFCHPLVIYGVVLLLTFLMLTNLRLWNIKGLRLRNGRWILAFLLAAAVVLLVWTYAAGIVLACLLYILFGVANMFLKLY